MATMTLDSVETEALGAEERPTPDAVRTLLNNHRQFLSFLEKRVKSRAVAEDILQEAFARAMNKVDALRSDESAVAWFYRVLRNALIDHRRRTGAAERKLSAFGLEVQDRLEPDIEMRGAICRCVSELAATIKSEYADALRMVQIEELALEDYAARAGISASNARVRVFRAREALRKQVLRSCGSCADHGCLDCSCGPSRAVGKPLA
jgi:RNA polymerase sigma factor (sigma-70 family)